MRWHLPSKDTKLQFECFADLVKSLSQSGQKLQCHSFTFQYDALSAAMELIKDVSYIAEFSIGNCEQQFYKPQLIIHNKPIKFFCKSKGSKVHEYTVYAEKIVVSFRNTGTDISNLIKRSDFLSICHLNCITMYKPKIIDGPNPCAIGADNIIKLSKYDSYRKA